MKMLAQRNIEGKFLRSALRTRKRNDVAHKLLQNQLEVMESMHSKEDRLLFEEKESIRFEIRDRKHERRSKSLQSLPSTRESVSPSLPLLPELLARTPSREKSFIRRNKLPELSCRFGVCTRKATCRHFPCYLPTTYNSLGYQLHKSTYSSVSNYDELLERCKPIRPPTSQSDFSDTFQVQDMPSHKAPRSSIQARERGLRQLIKEMKERNKQAKPRDWAINYGDPVSIRKLRKPVIPVSEVE